MDPDRVELHEQFLGLFTANEPALRAFVRRLLPSRGDVADVMQGVALVLWRKFEGVEDKSDFRKWAFGVARYETMAWLRDKARDRLVLAEDVLELVAEESSQHETWLAAQREALEGCLDRLSADQRVLVLAAYAPGAKIQRVAEESGRTVGAFYQWLHRLRSRLLECTRRALLSEDVS